MTIRTEEMVSIITPSYNSARFIAETIQSVINQTYSSWEMVITDDCSSDESCEIIRGFQRQDFRIKLFRLSKNSGPAAARNNSLANAKGRFIAFLDSDDTWLPTKLQNQIAFMQSRNIKFSYSGYREMNEDGSSLGKTIDLKSPPSVNYNDMLKKKSTMGCLTVMLDKQKLGSLEMPDIKTGQDYAFWLSLLREGTVAYNMREYLANYRVCSGSISRNKFRKAKRQWEIYRNIERIGFLKSLWCFGYYAWNATFRK